MKVEGAQVMRLTVRSTVLLSAGGWDRAGMRRGCIAAAALNAASVILLLTGCARTPTSGVPAVGHQPTSSSVTSDGASLNRQLRSRIVAGQGWGVVRIGAKRSEIESILGKPDDENADPNDGQFVHSDYTKLGVDVRYDSFRDRAVQVTFVKGATDMVGVGLFGNPDYLPFTGGTDQGVGWESTPQQIKAAYGKPQLDRPNDDDGHDGRDIVYPGITFYFDNDQLMLIHVSPK